MIAEKYGCQSGWGNVVPRFENGVNAYHSTKDGLVESESLKDYLKVFNKDPNCDNRYYHRDWDPSWDPESHPFIIKTA